MSDKKCCVPGCLRVSPGLHQFPHPEKDEERFHIWVNSVGGDILSLNNDFIFKYRRVCNAHFEEKYWCRNNRISRIAVPTLNMDSLTAINTEKPIQENKFIAKPEKLTPIGLEIPILTINEVVPMEAVDDQKMAPVIIPRKDPKKESIANSFINSHTNA